MSLISEIFVLIYQVFCVVLESCYRSVFPVADKEVKGKIVLITGSGRGLGRLLAARFAKLGARLVLWDINEDLNHETAEVVEALGAEVHSYACDCTSREEIYATASRVKGEVGDVDILVNNAGILHGKRLLDQTDAQIQKAIELNLLAHFWTSRSFLGRMLEQNQGHIVTISSVSGSFPTAFQVEYCASKYGAVGFHDALSHELYTLGKDGVKTTLVQPFFFDTGISWYPKMRFQKLHKVLEPSYVADQAMSAILKDMPSIFITRQWNFALVMKW
ncbi:predicted protein [Nematostella vectensis]|uniref:Short-chain dehydrogenase/reductase 3 n=1 Tax=Nematostella vectensis TaxID=45351 RepID=A7S945_NEMVE|nr:predicted protein [Nematostella vectensis]|eukprot:XP_001631852.1 predicted protein [Nematostella vectensis]